MTELERLAAELRVARAAMLDAREAARFAEAEMEQAKGRSKAATLAAHKAEGAYDLASRRLTMHASGAAEDPENAGWEERLAEMQATINRERRF